MSIGRMVVNTFIPSKALKENVNILHMMSCEYYYDIVR